MMKGEDRKAAVAAYKERKAVAGIYVVRCLATDGRWAGQAPDLGTIRNRIWFTLRHGGHRHPTLQAAWQEHGADSFVLDEVERFDEETLAYGRDRILRERLAHWCGELGASAI